jgi:hypothetical protein
MATSPGAGDAIDEGYSLGFESSEVALEVLGAVGDMVQAGSASLEEAADGGFRTERLEQLHGADEGDADSLSLEGFRRRAGLAGEELEDVPALFDGAYGEGHVVE